MVRIDAARKPCANMIKADTGERRARVVKVIVVQVKRCSEEIRIFDLNDGHTTAARYSVLVVGDGTVGIEDDGHQSNCRKVNWVLTLEWALHDDVRWYCRQSSSSLSGQRGIELQSSCSKS